MANYATLKAAIADVIKQNGNNEITGNILQQSLLAMVNSLGANYQFAGVATLSTDPGTPDQNVFYIASETGTYANFSNLSVVENEIAVFKYNGSWSKQTTGAAAAQKVNAISENINSDKITDQLIFGSVVESSKCTITQVSPTVLDNSYLNYVGGVQSIESAYYKVLEYSVNPGEKYRLVCSNSGQNAHFAFYNNSNKIFYYRGSENTITIDVIIPDGVNKLYVAYLSGVGSISSIIINQPEQIETETAKQKLENYNILSGYYINGYSGGLVEFGSNQSYKVAQANVIGGWQYELHASGLQRNGAYSFIDENGTVLAYGKITQAFTEETFNVTAPQNAVRVNIASYGTVYVSYFQSVMPVRRWKNKTWVVLGDSLTEVNARTSIRYYDYVADKTGLSVINRGISGTGYKNGEANNNAFYQRVGNIPACDVLTIFGSFNDNIYFDVMGTKDDTTADTIGGCINICLDNLFAAYPLVNVGIVAPCPWQYFYPGVTNSDNYVKLLKDICEKRGIPFYDLYHNSSLRPWEQSYRALCYSKDDWGGVHPDERGHQIIAPRFEDFLNELML